VRGVGANQSHFRAGLAPQQGQASLLFATPRGARKVFPVARIISLSS